ncbi:MAG: sugar ABC transporter permease, partial [Ktedonobacteraceae bacterium]|nr:sugar ABC transporter permease [Ktedonobacteraceae bacterium]
FTGFNNFYLALTDPIFGQSIFNTLVIWVISTIPMLALALAMAFLLNLRGRSKIVYQLCYFLPNITSIVAITVIFSSMFGTQFGLLNFVLTALHLPAVPWVTDPWGMKWAIALMVIWRWTGYNALIYMAGLQSIPSEYYEAARTDGANTWSVFRHITLPLLRPVILFTVITSTTGGLSLFTEPQVLLGNSGGTGHEGMTMSLYQYWQAFASYHFGYGAAVGWLIFLVMLVFTIINWRIVQGRER